MQANWRHHSLVWGLISLTSFYWKKTHEYIESLSLPLTPWTSANPRLRDPKALSSFPLMGFDLFLLTLSND